MKNYMLKLKICKLHTEKDKLKEIYRRVKKLALIENKTNTKQSEKQIAKEITKEITKEIESLIHEIKSTDLNVAVPGEYWEEAMECKCIEKLQEMYKKKYEETKKEERDKKQCFERFYQML